VQIVEVLMLLSLVQFLKCTADQGMVSKPLLPGLLLPVQQPLLCDQESVDIVMPKCCTCVSNHSVSASLIVRMITSKYVFACVMQHVFTADSCTVM
jgi:hypothetical protein